MSVGGQLIATCCCADSPPSGICIEAAVIGSCHGLISDPDCGIKPVIGEYQVLVQPTPGFSGTTICGTIIPCTQTSSATAIAPRELTYRLIGDVDGIPPCYWIWFTKARSIAYDLNFPSTNRCCCIGIGGVVGQYYAESCENSAVTPCTSPTVCSCDVYSSNHGPSSDDICVGNHTGCASVGTYDYERDGGGTLIPPGAGNSGGNWFTPKYPAANASEEGNDDWGSIPFVLQRNAGLSAYQLRVAANAYWWTWEIAQFNDGGPIKVNGLSYPYYAPWGAVGNAKKFYSDASSTAQDAAGGHPLFRYFHAFANAEFASIRRTAWPGANPDAGAKSVPWKFMFTADGVPVFSFEFDSDADRALFYQTEQYQVGATASATYWAAADSIDAIFKGAGWTSRMSAKDWRGEVSADIDTLVAWAAANQPAWTAPATVRAAFPAASNLKLMFPVRLPGDLWDLRALSTVDGSTTSARPPSLARVSTSGQSTMNIAGTPYVDSLSGATTGQVDSLVYTMSEPTGGIGVMSAGAQAAYKRLTRSVYFRTMPAGWDWSPAAAEGNGKKPRYNWLLDRQQGDLNASEVLRWTCPWAGACATDNAWCTNGLPNTVTLGGTCPPGDDCTGLGARCDLYMGHAGYDGSVNILVGRGEYPHTNGGVSGACCAPMGLSHHASATPTHATSNLCYYRHAGRTYYWDTTVAPYAMTLVSTLSPPTHPIDGAATCGPFPAIRSQNDTVQTALAFCGHLSGTTAGGAACVAHCVGTAACSEYSYLVVMPECEDVDACAATIIAGQVPSRPKGSITGQRDAPYVGFSGCTIVSPIPTADCICPNLCAHSYPVVVPVEDPP